MNRIIITKPVTGRGEDILSTAIDFTRFDKLPVLLNAHNHEIPIGMATDVRLDEHGLHFMPVFHNLTEGAHWMHFLNDWGLLRARPGGFIVRDKAGNITNFVLHEISLTYDRRNS